MLSRQIISRVYIHEGGWNFNEELWEMFIKLFCFFSLQKEKKDNPNRGNVNPRKIKTRKEEWEKMKMGQEFVESKEKPSRYLIL